MAYLLKHRTILSTVLFCALLLSILQVSTTQTAYAAVGFRVSGRNLLDVNGNNFIMRGINHPHAWFTSQTSSIANIKATGANTVRVVLSGGRWGTNGASDVSNIITLCKNNKLVCVLDYHDTTGYGEDAAGTSLTAAVNYWKSIQSVLTGQEAYVIINIGNEPYGNNNYGNWVNDTKNAIIAMRSTGFQHVLMVDAPNWGQDWSFTMRDSAPNVKAADTTGNTIFSVHMYGVFDTASEVQSYVSSFVSRGLPLVVGEFGDNHSDGNPDENTIMSQAQSNGIGYLGWSWSGNGGGVEYLDMVTSFNPSQRTAWGNRFITGANGLSTTSSQCTCYNPPATNTPIPLPTNTPIPNLVKNGEFDSGTTNWSLSQSNGGAGSMAVVSGAGMSGTNALRVLITNGGTANWHVQISQAPITITSGKTYTISFMAKAAANKTINVSLQQNVSPFTSYWSQNVNITTAATTYTYTFNSTVTNSNVALRFNVAGNTITTFIDKVSIK